MTTLEKYEESAKKGDIKAQFRVAQVYLDGQGVKKNEVEAAYWYLKAALKDEGIAQYNYAYMLEHIFGNIELAFKWYEKSAQQNDVEAQFCLGSMYETGRGVGKNEEKALAWYENAANQEHQQALFRLVDLYAARALRGKHERAAVKWYQKAAHLGYSNAQFYLARRYAKAYCIGKNEREAVKWYEQAAEQGHLKAQYYLAKLYASSHILKDEKKAVGWWRLSAERGMSKALKKLHTMKKNIYAGYVASILDKEYQQTANYLYAKPEICEEFLNKELSSFLQEKFNCNFWSEVFKEFKKKSKAHEMEDFSIKILLKLHKKIENVDLKSPVLTEIYLFIHNLFGLVALTELQAQNIKPLIQLIMEFWWRDPQYFSADQNQYVETLWYRAKTLDHSLEDDPDFVRQIACYLLHKRFGSKYALPLNFNAKLDLLFALEEDSDSLNQLVIPYHDHPIHLLPKLCQCVNNKAFWKQEHTVYIKRMAEYFSKIISQYPFLFENESDAKNTGKWIILAEEIFNDLSLRVARTLKYCSGTLFANRKPGYKEQKLLRILQEKNCTELSVFLNAYVLQSSERRPSCQASRDLSRAGGDPSLGLG